MVFDFDEEAVFALADPVLAVLLVEVVEEAGCLGLGRNNRDNLGCFDVFEFGCFPGPVVVAAFFAYAEVDFVGLRTSPSLVDKEKG